MYKVGDKVTLYGARTTRYGYIEYADRHGYIVRLYEGGSMYFRRKRIGKGHCYNSGGYSFTVTKGS